MCSVEEKGAMKANEIQLNETIKQFGEEHLFKEQKLEQITQEKNDLQQMNENLKARLDEK